MTFWNSVGEKERWIPTREADERRREVKMTAIRGRLVDGGRLVVPAAMRKSLGLETGSAVLMELHGDELRIRPVRSALRRIQEKLRVHAPAEGTLSDELIAERRAEAERE